MTSSCFQCHYRTTIKSSKKTNKKRYYYYHYASSSSSNSNSAKVIETIATNVLRLNLKTYQEIKVRVNSNDFEAIALGKLRAVTISGTNWQSRKDLTCERLQISVAGDEGVRIDYQSVLSGRIELRKPFARGRAELFLTVDDFKHFLKHPLTKKSLDNLDFMFVTDSYPLVITEKKCLRLKAIMNSIEYEFTMRPSEDEEGNVDVLEIFSDDHGNEAESTTERSDRIKEFFETLELDLMGTKLSYSNMIVRENGIFLDLNVVVERFPPPIIDF